MKPTYKAKVEQISPREKMLHRTFKMFVLRGLYKSTEFHEFLRWAKGKGESQLLTYMNDRVAKR